MRSPLPDPCYGDEHLNTISSSFQPSKYYKGYIAEWSTFKKDVLDFYRSARLRAALKRCEDKLISVNPDTHLTHEHFTTKLRAQVGNENSLSGVFFSHVLEPILAVCEALGKGTSDLNLSIPGDLTFGDSWINPSRLSEARPDIVLKRTDDHDIHLLGELKIVVSIDLEIEINKLSSGKEDTTAIRGILGFTLWLSPIYRTMLNVFLGQVVFYMVKYCLKYAFISNYHHTIFVMQGFKANGAPCIYYSQVILNKDIGDWDPKDPSISLRLALLYVISKSYSGNPKDWRLSDNIKLKNWIINKLGEPGAVGTPLHVARERSTIPDDLATRTSALSLGNSFNIAPPAVDLGPQTRSKAKQANVLTSNRQGLTQTATRLPQALPAGLQGLQGGNQQRNNSAGRTAPNQSGRQNITKRNDDEVERRDGTNRSRPGAERRGSSRGSKRGAGA